MAKFPILTHEPDVRAYPAGEIIFRRGDPGEGMMFAVVDGVVDIRVGDQVIDTLGAGDVLGEMALLERLDRAADAVARVDCRLAAISERRLLALISQNPPFALSLMRLLSARIRRNMPGE